MKIEPNVYLVGSGQNGFDMTNPFDCNIYLFETGDGYLMFDAGAGIEIERVLDTCRQDGIDPHQITHLFLTHAHGDHAGGAAHLYNRVAPKVHAGSDTAKIVRAGDEAAVCLDKAKSGGMYPADYVYRACPVAHVLEAGSVTSIEQLTIEAIPTPGHSHDHFSYLVSGLGKRYLVGGDAIFFGGKVVLQNTYDCDIPQTIASIQKLATLEFDALLAGHLAFSLNNGMRHIETACAIIDQMGCPASIL